MPARRADRQLARCLESRWEEVAFGLVPLVRQAGGTTAQKKAAGRKGGRAAARKS